MNSQLQGGRQLLPEMCLKRLQSTCKDKSKMSPEMRRFKALQAKMQVRIKKKKIKSNSTNINKLKYNFSA